MKQLVNSVVELESVEPELFQLVSRYLSELEQAYLSYLVEAEEMGELREGLQVSVLSGLLTTFIQALRKTVEWGTVKTN